MAALLRRGCRTLLLTGPLLQEPGAGLNVEDDARLLLEWYAHAEALVAASGPFEFDTDLDDGGFVISSNSDGERVRLRFDSVPELDSRQASTSAAEVSVQEYAWWGRSIAAGLLALADEQDAAG